MRKRVILDISDSAHGELIYYAQEKGCSKSLIVEALIFAYFWHNTNLLKWIANGEWKKHLQEFNLKASRKHFKKGVLK